MAICFPFDKCSFHRIYVDDKNIVLMQWTGLYDRDKNEIYRGDIINTNPYYPEQGLTYVDYVPQMARFKLLILSGKYIGQQSYYRLAQFASDTYAIVGNIYRHAHLLKSEEE